MSPTTTEPKPPDPTAVLPQFRQPAPPPPGQPEDPTPTPGRPVKAGDLVDYGDSWTPVEPRAHRSKADTRTGTSSSVSKPSQDDTVALVVGLLAVVVGVATLAIRWTRGRALRPPTDGQAEGIARPLARLGLRHLPAEIFNADLVDALTAATAVTGYLTDGPLTEPLDLEPDIPDDLQES